MSNALTTLNNSAAAYAVQSHGSGTLKAYRVAWGQFCYHHPDPLRAGEDDICAWLALRADAGISVSSIRVAAAALRHAFKLAGVPWPGSERLRMVLAGITRAKGAAGGQKASAATAEALRAMLAHVVHPCHRAMLLTGFGAALRRSELMGLDLADVQIEPRGVLVTVRQSKTDQDGRGEIRAIVRGSPGFCAAEALESWLAIRGRNPGPLFGVMIGGVPQRYIDQQVSRVVATAARAAGLPGRWSSHSLRAGMITTAAALGGSLEAIARHARHVRLDTTAGYIRPETAWADNVTSLVFGEAAAPTQPARSGWRTLPR